MVVINTKRTGQTSKSPLKQVVSTPTITKNSVPTIATLKKNNTNNKNIKQPFIPPRVPAGSGTIPTQVFFDEIHTESCGIQGEFI